MNKSRLRKAEAILSELRAHESPLLDNLIIYTDEADCERQLGEWEAKGGTGTVILLPDNGRGPKTA